MTDIRTHHMIYGHCQDYITGETIVDTDDERIRQQLARMLVEELGYAKDEVKVHQAIDTLFNGQFVTSKVDMALRLQGHFFLVVRYGPGSLVTRERAAVAAARVWHEEYQIPLAVVTNGQDAELLDTASGEVLATGMAAIPSRQKAMEMLDSLSFEPLTDEKRRQREKRVLNSFDVEVCCV